MANAEEQREQLKRELAEIISARLSDAFAEMLVERIAARVAKSAVAGIRRHLQLAGVDESSTETIAAAAKKALADRFNAGAHQGLRQAREREEAARSSRLAPLPPAPGETIH